MKSRRSNKIGKKAVRATSDISQQLQGQKVTGLGNHNAHAGNWPYLLKGKAC